MEAVQFASPRRAWSRLPGKEECSCLSAYLFMFLFSDVLGRISRGREHIGSMDGAINRGNGWVGSTMQAPPRYARLARHEKGRRPLQAPTQPGGWRRLCR